MNKFTEKETEEYYDKEDKIYQSFWDKEGSIHWGYFDQTTGDDFNKASTRLTDVMAEKSNLSSDSYLLNIGSGNGVVDIYLAKKFGCRTEGIELSGVRVNNAKEFLLKESKEIQERVNFTKGSGADLPFKDETFTNVFIQATLYHIHERKKALKEIYRVLKKEGLFVFDDLFKPKKEISEETKKYMYDRLLFDTDFSFESYKEHLESIGFEVLETQDLSEHLAKSYLILSKIIKRKLEGEELNAEVIDRYEFLVKAFNVSSDAVGKGEVGWGMFVCRK